jgi:hypothetical protein
MTHGIIVPSKIKASDIDALNRVAVSADDIDNGNVFELLTRSTTTGESEVWVATASTGTLSNIWMAMSPEVVVSVSGSNKFKGLDVDPGNFYNIAGDMIDVYRPQIGDVIVLTGDAISTASAAAASAYAIVTSGSYKLYWSAAVAVSGLTFKYLNTTYISKPSGAISETQRVVAYLLECTAVA